MTKCMFYQYRYDVSHEYLLETVHRYLETNLLLSLIILILFKLFHFICKNNKNISNINDNTNNNFTKNKVFIHG